MPTLPSAPRLAALRVAHGLTSVNRGNRVTSIDPAPAIYLIAYAMHAVADIILLGVAVMKYLL